MTPNKHALIIQCRRSHKPNLIHSILQRTHTFISLIFITSGERRRKESGKQKLTTTILNTIAGVAKTRHKSWNTEKSHCLWTQLQSLFSIAWGTKSQFCKSSVVYVQCVQVWICVATPIPQSPGHFVGTTFDFHKIAIKFKIHSQSERKNLCTNESSSFDCTRQCLRRLLCLFTYVILVHNLLSCHAVLGAHVSLSLFLNSGVCTKKKIRHSSRPKYDFRKSIAHLSLKLVCENLVSPLLLLIYKCIYS